MKPGPVRDPPDGQAYSSSPAKTLSDGIWEPCRLLSLSVLGETPKPSARPTGAGNLGALLLLKVALLFPPSGKLPLLSLSVTTPSGQLALLLRAAQSQRPRAPTVLHSPRRRAPPSQESVHQDGPAPAPWEWLSSPLSHSCIKPRTLQPLGATESHFPWSRHPAQTQASLHGSVFSHTWLLVLGAQAETAGHRKEASAF